MVEDFSHHALYTLDRAFFDRLQAKGQKSLEEQAADYGKGFEYLALDQSSLGPLPPQEFQTSQADASWAIAQDSRASPESGQFKWLIWTLGSSCERCNAQVAALNTIQTILESIQTDLVYLP